MNRVFKPFSSSIGCKLIMASTGVLLVGFLVAHLSGNLLVFAGPEAINAYSKGLRDYLPLLNLARAGLILFAILHIFAGIKLTRLNQIAKPKKYQVSKPVQATVASRFMPQTGLVVLAFILYHLAHLTFRLTHDEFASLDPHDAYGMLMLSFQSPFLVGFYCVSILLLMLHLSHGISSFFQTLGLNHGKYNKAFKLLGPSLSLALGLGFISIPVSIYLGVIN